MSWTLENMVPLNSLAVFLISFDITDTTLEIMVTPLSQCQLKLKHTNLPPLAWK